MNKDLSCCLELPERIKAVETHGIPEMVCRVLTCYLIEPELGM